MLSVATDNASTYVISQSTAGSWQQAIPSYGNLRLLVVGIVAMNSDPAGMTYDTVPLTRLATVPSPGGTHLTRASVWALQNPTLGSNTLRITWSGTLSVRIVVRSYFNVHAYTPLGTPQTYGGNTVSTNLTFPDSQNQGYSFHVGGFGGTGTRTISAGETTIFNNVDLYGSTYIGAMCAEKATTGANAALGFSSNLARDFAHVGVAIKPFPGGRTFQIVNNA